MLFLILLFLQYDLLRLLGHHDSVEFAQLFIVGLGKETVVYLKVTDKAQRITRLRKTVCILRRIVIQFKNSWRRHLIHNIVRREYDFTHIQFLDRTAKVNRIFAGLALERILLFLQTQKRIQIDDIG